MFDENDEDLEEFENVDREEIKKDLPNYDSKKLCDIIISDRYLGFDPDLALSCMQELGQRRVNGDIFDFEGYIEKEYNQLPKLDFTMPDFSSSLNKILGNFIK